MVEETKLLKPENCMQTTTSVTALPVHDQTSAEEQFANRQAESLDFNQKTLCPASQKPGALLECTRSTPSSNVAVTFV